MIKYFLVYLAAISVISTALTISDKHRAKNNKWRIKERTLLIIALLGGALAEYITMKLIHHKTKHTKFMLGLPAIIIIHIAIIIFVYLKVAQIV